MDYITNCRFYGYVTPWWRLFVFIAEAPKIELVEGEDGELMISIPISAAPKKLPQYYGFTTGRHSGSMFLKIGAAVFCVIHIIHLFLIIVKEVSDFKSLEMENFW